jgi:hypothetical protein
MPIPKLNRRGLYGLIIIALLPVSLSRHALLFTPVVDAVPNSPFPQLGNEIVVLDYDPSCWDGTRGGPHNLDIVELNKDGHRYWGYYGTADHASVGLAFSDDLETWTRYSTTNPLIDGFGWPTVGIQNGIIHMFYIKGGILSGIYRATSPVSDGYTFTEQEVVVQNANGPHDPFLWHSPVDGEWWLLWKENINVGTIKCCHATNIEDLSSASIIVLRTETDSFYGTLAAPGIFYWNTMYYLTDESHPGLWQIRAFYSSVLDSGCFNGACECSNSPILVNDDACGFPHVEGDTLYYYYSHQVGPGWNLKLKKSTTPPPPPPPAGWWDVNWQYRKTVTIDHTKVDADLTGFPVLIEITDPDLASHSQNDGDDIVFTDNTGVRLNHEIELYDNTIGHLVAWVRADLSSVSDTTLYMYYGNPSASNQQNPTGVWDSNYVMVQHLDETVAPFPPEKWYKYSGNPTLSGVRNGFASVFYDSSSGIYHLYCSWTSILHFTSSDGKTGWTPDPGNPVLSGNNEGVPMVWKEDSTWYMLYRYGGPDKIGLATSTDATHWTRYGGNPVLTEGGFIDPWGVIKVGSTYYLWYNDGDGGRAARLATSTDLVHWTKDPNNPIFTGGRFCVFPFKYGGYYYMLVPHYTSGPYGEIELYRDVNPTFYPSSREYLGVPIIPGPAGTWDDHRFDTPCVLTDTIYRDTYTAANNELWVYYAATGTLTGSGADWWTGMCIEQDINDALTRFGQPTPYSHFDSTANHNDGRAEGNMNLDVTGKIDGADVFDGTDDFIDCGDGSTLKGMSGLTVEAWVKPNAIGPIGAGIVSKWASWMSGSYIMWWGSAGSVGWGVITSPTTYASLSDTPVITIGQWQHFAGVYDGSQIRLYKNAALIGTPKSLTGNVMSQTTPCYIGRYTTPFMNGIVDEVRISNVSRSVSWITIEYNNQLDPSTFFTVGTEEARVATVETATGTGIATFELDVGIIQDLVAINEATLPLVGKPGAIFPHGFFRFRVAGLTPGQTVTITITLPSAVPVGTLWYKYDISVGWISLPIGSDDGDNVITLSITDGGTGDFDPTPRVILDPGGPGIPLPSPPVGILAKYDINDEFKENDPTIGDEFTTDMYGAIAASDDIYAVTRVLHLYDYSQQIFRFGVGTGLAEFTVAWEGNIAFQDLPGGPHTEGIDIWNRATNSWESVGTVSQVGDFQTFPGPLPGASVQYKMSFMVPDEVISKIYKTNVNDYVTGGHVYLMVWAKNSHDATVCTDYVKLDCKYRNLKADSQSASPSTVTQGETVHITVTVKNTGATTETFDVDLKYDSTVLHTWTSVTLGSSAQIVLTWDWVTSGVSPGTYSMAAMVDPTNAIAETDEMDNTCTVPSAVTIKSPPSPPVGGEWLPIDKLSLLAPWIGLASSLTVGAIAAVSVAYVKHRKKHQN